MERPLHYRMHSALNTFLLTLLQNVQPILPVADAHARRLGQADGAPQSQTAKCRTRLLHWVDFLVLMGILSI